MSNEDYTPLTGLEQVVRNGMAGIGGEHDILEALMATRIFVPSATQCTAAGDNLSPLVVQSQRYGSPMVVVFDDARHIAPEAARMAPYCLEADATWLVQAMAPGHGITLLVGPTMGCEISPEQVAGKRQALAGQ